MPKFTLIAEHTNDYGETLSKNTHEFDVEFLQEVLENVDLFLRGTGFFSSGNLQYVPDEPPPFEFTQEMVDAFKRQHSDFYFDEDRNK
jgi:hypothetical protein